MRIYWSFCGILFWWAGAPLFGRGRRMRPWRAYPKGLKLALFIERERAKEGQGEPRYAKAEALAYLGRIDISLEV
jgi:hypothetical protein